MQISKVKLSLMRPDVKGKKVSLYYLNEKVLVKRFFKLIDDEKRMKIARYEYGKTTTGISALNLPLDTLETEKGFDGYIEPIIPGTLEGELIGFGDYINAHFYDLL